MAIRKIAILGSTGSIGTTALRVAEKFPERFEIAALAAGDNVEVLADQVRRFKPRLVSTRTEEAMQRLKKKTGDMFGISYAYGTDGAEQVATFEGVDVVLSAIVGAAGLRPTIAAVRKGRVVALANKESMVVAGALVSQEAAKHGAQLLPVDSEHNAIFQALSGAPKHSVKRLILTASGGPFFRNVELDLSKVTREQALNHPNWKMGEKITIDSATLMNKGLEIIEAYWLFGFPARQIDAIIHPQSIIHSMVEYVDGSVLAQLGVPDMAGPIAFALAYPERLGQVMESLQFSKVKELQFFEPDHERFPAINLARQALEMGPTFPAVLNGANEVTVQAFLDRKIGFLDIVQTNRDVLISYTEKSSGDLEDFLSADRWGREQATRMIKS